MTCLTVERTIREIARVGHIRHAFTTWMLTRALPFASVEFDVGEKSASCATKIKRSGENHALEMGMRHLGVFERDNAQSGESLTLQVVLMARK